MSPRFWSVALIFLATGFPAAAQNTLEEVVVTAQKRAQSAQDISIAVSAFSGDNLKDFGVVDTSDLSKLVPGFRSSPSGYSLPVYTLRGIGFNGISQSGSSSVGVYVDEVNIPFPAMTKGATLDTQRVEVLKGPQGTLYGRNTTGGAINYITNKPTPTLEAGITGSYGRFETSNVEGHVSGPLVDSLGARFAFRRFNRGQGWQKDIFTGEELGEIEKLAGRLTLEWLPANSFRLSLTGSGWSEDGEPQSPQPFVKTGQAALAGFEPSDEFKAHPILDEEDNRATAFETEKDWFLDEAFGEAALRADWDIRDNVTMTVIGAHQEYENDNHLNLDGMAVEEFEYFIETDTDVNTYELRFSGRAFDQSVDWVMGYFYAEDTVHEFRDFYLKDNSTGNGGVALKTITLDGTQDSVSQAVFGQAEWQMTPAFALTLGLRATDEERDYDACIADKEGDVALVFTALEYAEQNGAGTLAGEVLTNDQADAFLDLVNALSGGTNNNAEALNDALVTALAAGLGDAGPLLGGPGQGDCFTLDENNNAGPISGRLEEDNISGRIALDWTPREELLTYISLSRGFKSGSFPLVPASRAEQLEAVTQERLDALEIGLKSQFLDNKLRLNAAAFYYEYKDKQLFAIFEDEVFGTLQKLDNVPESEIIGAEAEVQYMPLAGLLMSLSVSHLQSEITEFVGLNLEGEQEDFSGNEINFTPNWEATALVNYERPFTDRLAFLIGVDASYSSEAEGDLTNDPDFTQDEYYILNARVGIKGIDDSWRISVWGKNITNEFYVNSLQRLSDVGVRYTGMPATYGIRFSYSFR